MKASIYSVYVYKLGEIRKPSLRVTLTLSELAGETDRALYEPLRPTVLECFGEGEI